MIGGRRLLLMALVALGAGCAEPLADGARASGGVKPVASEKLFITAPGERQVELSLFYPAEGCRQCALILFSHGAASTPERYSVLTNAWARAGFVVAGPLHVDSEAHEARESFEPSQYLALRIEDVETALEILFVDTEAVPGVSFNGAYIAAGHSFGGLVAQVLGGARPHRKSGARPAAAAKGPGAIIAISPPPAIPDYIDAEGWSAVDAPMLVITGTKDVLPGFVEEWEAHLDSYEAAPASLAYGAVFEGMDHYFNGAFGRVAAQQDEDAAPAVHRLNGMILDFIQYTTRSDGPAYDEWGAQSDPIAAILTRANEVENNDDS